MIMAAVSRALQAAHCEGVNAAKLNLPQKSLLQERLKPRLFFRVAIYRLSEFFEQIRHCFHKVSHRFV